MSNDSSDTSSATIQPIKRWSLLDGGILWLIVYRAPYYFISDVAPYLTPILPQVENLRNATVYLLVELVTLGLLTVVTRLYGLNFRDLGLGSIKLSFIFKVLIGYVIYFGLAIVAISLAKNLMGLNVDETQELGFKSPTVSENMLIFGLLVVVVPLTEELVFRGFLFKILRDRFGFVLTTLAVSALFGLVHGLIGVGVDVFVLSLVLCYLREKTGSLWPAVMLHSLKNSIAFFALFIYNMH